MRDIEIAKYQPFVQLVCSAGRAVSTNLSPSKTLMFRKPKSKRKTSFRKPGGSGDGGVDNGRSTSGGGSKFRKRSNSSSDEDNDNNNEGGTGTSELLEQLRREKAASKAGGSKKRRIGDGDERDDKKGGGGGVMHEFKATDERLTDKEMATRMAEHHPTAITQGLEKTDDKRGASATATNNDTEDAADGDGGKVYKGQNAPARNKFLAGPLKAPSFVRTTCRFDYQPDICKDYKDTGFCGFGDTCIYLHDRSDTLTGWQLEKQYEERKKAEREAKEKEMDKFLARASGELGVEDQEEEEDRAAAAAAMDGLPFACHLCRNPFTDPVVTNCNHYYCQQCIMTHVQRESSACPICGKDTGGVFNHPSKLLSKKRRLVGSSCTWQEFAEAAKKV